MGSHESKVLIDRSHGATNGFCMGMSYYSSDDYGQPGIHADQEGFYVLEGTGTAKVAGAEFRIGPGSAFLVRAGLPHTIKKDPDSKLVAVLWSHGAS